jgi:hypothetical protein
VYKELTTLVVKLSEIAGGGSKGHASWKTEHGIDGSEDVCKLWPIADSSVAKTYGGGIMMRSGRAEVVLNELKEFLALSGMSEADIAEDSGVVEATKMLALGAVTTFEAYVVKSRTMGGIARRKAYQKMVQDLKESHGEQAMCHPALWAYAVDAQGPTK